MPPVAKLIDIVKSGTLGQVRMVAIREHRFPFLVKVYAGVITCSTLQFLLFLTATTLVGKQLEQV
jgi:hypothetical protein